jgi:hypothetical protein
VDPSVTIPNDLDVEADGTLTVPVNLDDGHPQGSTGLIEAHLALTYDSRQFSVSAADVHLGSVLAAGNGWSVVPTIDPITEEIAIALSSNTPISSSIGGSLVTIDFHPVGYGEPSGVSRRVSGSGKIALVASVSPNGQYVPTELEDAQGAFSLTPAPTNGFHSRLDEIVTLTASPTGALASSIVLGAPASVEFQAESSSVAAAATVDTAASPAASDATNSESRKQTGFEGPSAVTDTRTLQVSARAAHGAATVLAASGSFAAAGAGSPAATPPTGMVFLLANTLVGNAPAWSGSAAAQPGAEPLFPALARGINPDDPTTLGGTIQDIIERVLGGQPMRSQARVENQNGDSVGTDLEGQDVGAWLALGGRHLRHAQAAERPTFAERFTQAAAKRASLDLYFAQMADESGQGREDE